MNNPYPGGSGQIVQECSPRPKFGQPNKRFKEKPPSQIAKALGLEGTYFAPIFLR